MSYIPVGPIHSSRPLVTGNTGGNTALISMLQALVTDGIIDWIAADRYGKTVVATPGIVAWYRFSDANQAAGLVDAWGNAIGTPHNGTYSSGGVTYGATGEPGTSPATAATFNGTSGTASVSLDLSAYNAITVEFWLNWTGTAGDDKLAMVFTNTGSQFYAVPGSFMVSPDSSFDSGFEVSMGNGSGTRFSGGKFARPSNGAWHHYALTMNRPTGIIQAYVDGALPTFTYTVSGTSNTNFGSLVLWFMSFSGTAQFAPGTIQDVVIYNRILSASEVSAHYAAR